MFLSFTVLGVVGYRGISNGPGRAFFVQVDYFRVTDSPLDCQW
jgi:predicted SnoaL-like aldol condensation-catalyzing enzyme